MILATRVTATDLIRLFREIKAPHPPCESPLDLTVGEDYFTAIANDLPGVQDYNHMTSLLETGDFPDLDKAIDKFLRSHETTPLREAVTFLSIYSKFARALKIESPIFRDAEKSFAEAKLLYPESTLIPVIVSTVAAQHLKEGLYEKSLGLYRTARETYPFNELTCVFQAGVAESSLQLHDYTAAKASFEQLMQKCQNRRLRFAATMRIAEIKHRVSGVSPDPILQKIHSESPKLAQRYFPSLLYVLGEKSFATDNLSSAKFFLNEYLRTNQPWECKAYAAKRLADVALAGSGQAKDIIGKYLEVKESYPATDPGRFSHIRAMLLSLGGVAEAEVERRLKVIDEEIDQIQNKPLREVAYLEKALGLLDAGEPDAVGSLVKVKKNSKLEISKGRVADFIRARVMEILAARMNGLEEITDPKALADYAGGELELYDAVMGTWLSKTPLQKKAQTLVRDRLKQLASKALSLDRPELALVILEKAAAGEVLPKEGPRFADVGFRSYIAERYLTRLFKSSQKEKLAENFMKNRERWAPFVEPASPLVWLSAAVESGDEQSIVETAKRVGAERAPAATGTLSPLMKDYYRLNQGKAMVLLKRWGEADRRLADVSSGELKVSADHLRMQIALEQKNFSRALDIGLVLLKKTEPAQRESLLDTLRQVCYDGHLWGKAEALVGEAKKQALPEEKMIPFHYLAGKSYAERNRCAQAVPELELALMKQPQATESNEARYRLGKCLMSMRKAGQARKIWQELAAIQDPFWSKLARNELNLSQNH